MEILISDLGSKVENNKLHSIGQTSILLEWKEEKSKNVLYRMLLDMGLKTKIDNTLDLTNISKIQDTMNDKVPGYQSGIQAMICSHCHEDHIGGYPLFYQWCKDKGFPSNGIPELYMTGLTWELFKPFQTDLYDILVKPSENSGYTWDKGILNVIDTYRKVKSYNSEISITPNPQTFDIKIKFIPSGHIVGSAMTEIDTIKDGKSLGKVLYTGDMCVRNGGFLVDGIGSLVSKNRIKYDSYKTVIMEGTYFWNLPSEETAKTETTPIKKESSEKLLDILRKKIIDTLSDGGNLILLVYGMDRSANILSAIRILIDENKLGIDIRNKVFFDTKLGSDITYEYTKEFDKFTRFDFPIDQYSYFSDSIVNRYRNNGVSMLQLDDKSTFYQKIGSIDARKSIVDEFKDGSCIVVATSATLMGGTALMDGGYMHPDGWGSDKKHLFLIVGSAIPGVKAKISINKHKKYGQCDLTYWNIKPEGGFEYSDSTFSGRLEELREFSAHANYEELRNFRERITSDSFLITHVGSKNRGIEKIRDYAITDFNKAIILTNDSKCHVKLEDTPIRMSIDDITYDMLYHKTLNNKGYYNDINACNVIRRLISEDNKRLSVDNNST